MLRKIFKKLRTSFQIENPNGVIGINKRNIELVYAHNRRENYHLADDKSKSKEILHANGIACAETFAVIKDMRDIRKSWADCKAKDAMAIKPSNGFGGEGIIIIKKNENGKWLHRGIEISEQQIFRHITSILSGLYSMNSSDSCLIEECIVPHPFFAEIYDDGVPDFRVITVKNKPVMAMLRMPTSKSRGKANLHQNGVGIGVDLKTGTLTQVFDGKRYSYHHPDSPGIVLGRSIPYWQEILDLSVATSKAFPLDFLGIDVVIDKHKGPQIMEVNVRSGLGIQLVNQCGLAKAIRDNMD